MKKCIKIVIISMIFACALVGCSQPGKKQEKEIPNTAWQEYIDVSDFSVAYSFAEKYPNKTILTWVLPIGACSDNNSAVYQEFNRLLDLKGFPYAVDFYVLDSDGEEYYQKIRSLKNSGASVDIFNTGFDYFGGLYDLCIEEKLCASWNDFFLSETGKQLYSSKNEIIWESVSSNEIVYGITGNAEAPVSNHFTYYFNKSLLEKYKMDAEELVSDSAKLLKAIKSIGEQEKTIIPCGLVNTSGLFFLPDYSSKILPFGYSKSSGEVVNLIATENGKELLRLYINDEIRVVRDFTETSKSDYFIFVEQNNNYEKANYENDDFVLINGNADYINVSGCVNCVAQWSTHQNEAFSLLSAIHLDKDLSKVLAYGIEGANYSEKSGEIEVIDAYSSMGDLFLPNKAFFIKTNDAAADRRINIVDGTFLGKRLNYFNCYAEVLKIEQIYNDLAPNILDKKGWNSENFTEKYEAVINSFEYEGNEYVINCLNAENNK